MYVGEGDCQILSPVVAPDVRHPLVVVLYVTNTRLGIFFHCSSVTSKVEYKDGMPFLLNNIVEERDIIVIIFTMRNS